YIYMQEDFFQAGVTYTATGYRGIEEWNTEDPQASITVKDVTPPTPVVTESTIYTVDTEISGISDEPGAKVSATIIGISLLDEDAGITVGNDGSWAFSIPDTVTLVAGDKIHIFLTDVANNKNPKNDTAFHDAI